MDRDAQLPTILSLPSSLPYPLTIRALLVRPGDRIRRGQKLLTYEYTARDVRMATIDSTRVGDGSDRDGNGEGSRGGPRVQKGGKGGGTRKAGGDWDAAVEGEVVQWAEGIKAGAVISGPGQQAIYIQEPCSHPVVFSGLCAVCGKDLDEMADYLADSPSAGPSAPASGPSASPPLDDSYRGGLSIDHEDARIKVSPEEAHRLAQAGRAQLHKARRLIMVVDLDQTVVHAAVDPTIGEWLNECGFWERSRLGGQGQAGHDERSTTPDGEPEGTAPNKSENPNKAALADVFRFQLPNEMPAGFARGRFSQALPEDGEGCWYYIKPRPGLPKFLEDMHKLYELHVYTAGSRTYANAVCKGIDPEGKYFGDRILSRDESGNAAQKNLRRLFPADQSMVVVIDDRYEVWNHAANLVKVVPYDFFVGMGDINSAFVAPRAIDDTPAPPQAIGDAAASGEQPVDVSTGSAEVKELLDHQAVQILEEQLLERPLAKKQAELAGHEVEGDATGEGAQPSGATASDAGAAAESPAKALLRADDAELGRLQHLLTEIHGRFFDALKDNREAYRIPASLETSPNVLYDVRHIIPHMQRKVLNGCTILFSGIVPLNQQPEQNEHWVLAKMFGARCVHHLSPQVTHLVTSQADTKKVYQAQKQKGTLVVWKEWLRHSIDMWQRQAEEKYLVKPSAAKAVTDLAEAPAEGTQTRPDTPTSDGGDDDLDEEGHLHLNVDFDDMDAEMAAFLAESDSEAGSEASSPKSSPIRLGNKKRPRKSALANEITASSSPTPEPGFEGVDGKPFAKRARFAAEDGDIATEFADMEEERDVEDYDEYPDEDGAEENAEDEEDDAAKEVSGGMLLDDERMPGEIPQLPAEQLQLDLATGNADDAAQDEALQGRTQANT